MTEDKPMLNAHQIQVIEDLLAERMKNTGESRAQASEHIANYFRGLLEMQRAE